MNDVQVGEGATERGYVVEPKSMETLRLRTLIANDKLDEWWVTHLRNGQVTRLRIDFHARIELASGTTVRVPLDALTYEETIETDIFGGGNASDGGADSPGGETATGDGTSTGTSTDGTVTTTGGTGTTDGGATTTDDGILDDGNGTTTGGMIALRGRV
jgi:hypothetical protein